MTTVQEPVSTVPEKAKAWGVHSITLAGLVWACLAMIALGNDQVKLMWLFLGIAMVLDGLDGPLARKYGVKIHAPNMDGSILDIVIDYLTWTFIPAYFLFLSGLTGNVGWSAAMFMVICISSMFCYANVGMKTDDLYFMGFPAAWNVVAAVMYIIEPPVWANIVIIILLAALTVSPITFLHPFRVKALRGVNVVATALWLITMVWLVAVAPELPLVVLIIWWISGVWIVLSGLLGGFVAKLAIKHPVKAARIRAAVGLTK